MIRDIKIKDKVFKIFIPETEISAIIHSMAKNINEMRIKDPLFISVLNGSFMFAAEIMRRITIPNSEISFIKLSSYSGISSRGKIDKLIGLSESIKGRNVIIGKSFGAVSISLYSLIVNVFHFVA